MDPKYLNTALFTDGTQRQHNRDRRSNFSGHKKYYCLGYLVTCAPDGLVTYLDGAFSGRKPDHQNQNESYLSGRLIAMKFSVIHLAMKVIISLQYLLAT